MLEKLLQAAAITLLLIVLSGIGTSKPTGAPNPLFHALSLPTIKPSGSMLL